MTKILTALLGLKNVIRLNWGGLFLSKTENLESFALKAREAASHGGNST